MNPNQGHKGPADNNRPVTRGPAETIGPIAGTASVSTACALAPRLSTPPKPQMGHHTSGKTRRCPYSGLVPSSELQSTKLPITGSSEVISAHMQHTSTAVPCLLRYHHMHCYGHPFCTNVSMHCRGHHAANTTARSHLFLSVAPHTFIVSKQGGHSISPPDNSHTYQAAPMRCPPPHSLQSRHWGTTWHPYRTQAHMTLDSHS